MTGELRNATKLCITDVGSTTTKVILFQRGEDGTWTYVRREAPTTVERPYEDVSIGVLQAFRALEEATGETLLADGVPAIPYLSTSSAGGGLAMVVTGLIKQLTAETAQRVAMGAGAIGAGGRAVVFAGGGRLVVSAVAVATGGRAVIGA